MNKYLIIFLLGVVPILCHADEYISPYFSYQNYGVSSEGDVSPVYASDESGEGNIPADIQQISDFIIQASEAAINAEYEARVNEIKRLRREKASYEKAQRATEEDLRNNQKLQKANSLEQNLLREKSLKIENSLRTQEKLHNDLTNEIKKLKEKIPSSKNEKVEINSKIHQLESEKANLVKNMEAETKNLDSVKASLLKAEARGKVIAQKLSSLTKSIAKYSKNAQKSAEQLKNSLKGLKEIAAFKGSFNSWKTVGPMKVLTGLKSFRLQSISGVALGGLQTFLQAWATAQYAKTVTENAIKSLLAIENNDFGEYYKISEDMAKETIGLGTAISLVQIGSWIGTVFAPGIGTAIGACAGGLIGLFVNKAFTDFIYKLWKDVGWLGEDVFRNNFNFYKEKIAQLEQTIQNLQNSLTQMYSQTKDDWIAKVQNFVDQIKRVVQLIKDIIKIYKDIQDIWKTLQDIIQNTTRSVVEFPTVVGDDSSPKRNESNNPVKLNTHKVY